MKKRARPTLSLYNSFGWLVPPSGKWKRNNPSGLNLWRVIFV